MSHLNVIRTIALITSLSSLPSKSIELSGNTPMSRVVEMLSGNIHMFLNPTYLDVRLSITKFKCHSRVLNLLLNLNTISNRH